MVWKAAAVGSWILPPSYIEDSIRSGKWEKEEKYQLKGFAPRAVRIESNPILLSDFSIFVAADSKPNQSFLREIIEIVGGKLSFDIEKCDLALGPFVKNSQTIQESWVFDSISRGHVLDHKKYISLPQNCTNKKPKMLYESTFAYSHNYTKAHLLTVTTKKELASSTN